jgi:phospholipid-binding lipoprotein MlaA
VSALRRVRLVLGAAALCTLSACATAPTGAAAPALSAPAIDPWENWNRKVFDFNEGLDKAVLRPVAQAYQDAVPAFVRTSVGNVLGNIHDVWSAANQLLQGKVQAGLEMGMRVLTNTVLGLGGILDPATEVGLTRRSEDFGQTLARWGVGNGPYLVLPVLGPSTLRDGAATLVDLQASPSKLPDSARGRTGVTAVEVVDVRARLLQAGQLVDQVALDKYSFFRDAYLARRRDAIFDGAPPMDTFEDESADPAKPPAPASAAPQ